MTSDGDILMLAQCLREATRACDVATQEHDAAREREIATMLKLESAWAIERDAREALLKAVEP